MNSFIWYELMTDNVDSAARFYGAVIGWKLEGDAHSQGTGPAGYRQLGRKDGGSAGGVLPITADMKANGVRPVWMPYLYVSDIAAAIEAIKKDGGRVHLPPMKLEVGVIAMLSDPQGVPIYIMAPVPPPGKPDAQSDVFSPSEVQRVSWNELASPDLAGSKAFYAKHFGFEFKESMPMGPAGDYCFIDQQGTRLGAIMQQQAGDQPAQWLMYCRVPSVEAAKGAVEANGGKVHEGPHQVPGGDWIVIASDPSGARFGVVGPRS